MGFDRFIIYSELYSHSLPSSVYVHNLQHTRSFLSIYSLMGKWAMPGGTAIPGQPVIRLEQAPSPHPLTKMSLISKGTHGPRIRY